MSLFTSPEKKRTACTNAVLHFVQCSLMLLGLLLVMGFSDTYRNALEDSSGSPVAKTEPALMPLDALIELSDALASIPLVNADVSLRTQSMLDYATQRYRLPEETLLPVLEIAQSVGEEAQIDPFLIAAIIGVESGFQANAQGGAGAQGLMQVIPRFHRNKIPKALSGKSMLNPAVNIHVGVQVLQEAIARRGSLVAGLQAYSGSRASAGRYSSKVLAEKERLEQAAYADVGPSA